MHAALPTYLCTMCRILGILSPLPAGRRSIGTVRVVIVVLVDVETVFLKVLKLVSNFEGWGGGSLVNIVRTLLQWDPEARGGVFIVRPPT